MAIQSGLARHAHSFAHFHGPVEGPGHEVVVHDKHGHRQVDYVAHPKYEFAYGVEDHHTGDYHGHKEHRDGKQRIVIALRRVSTPSNPSRVQHVKRKFIINARRGSTFDRVEQSCMSSVRKRRDNSKLPLLRFLYYYTSPFPLEDPLNMSVCFLHSKDRRDYNRDTFRSSFRLRDYAITVRRNVFEVFLRRCSDMWRVAESFPLEFHCLILPGNSKPRP